MIPITQFLNALNLINTYSGLILVYVILNAPMATLDYRYFFYESTPEPGRSCHIDGCAFNILSKILIPVLPGLISATILVFVQIYNEFCLVLR